MRTFRTCLAAWLGITVSMSTVAAVAAESGIRIGYSESLQHYTVHSQTTNSIGDKKSAAMQFQAFGRQFDFTLEKNRTLLRDIEQRFASKGIAVYRGEIDGIANSWARFIVADGVLRGMFSDGDLIYAIESPVDAAGNPNTIIYRLDDLVIAPETLRCSHANGVSNAAQLVEIINSESKTMLAEAPGAVSTMDIGLVADFEFTSDKGADTDMALIDRISIVDGIFSSQLGVQLTVTHIDSFSSSNDPFSDTTDAGVLIDEIAAFRNQSMEQRATGLTHLFTGRNLDDSNVGIAFSGALCSAFFGAGLTQGTHSPFIDALIAAHELGHNFGAPHDGTPGSACEATPPDFLMASSVNGNDQFSACSITEMQDNVAAASCITPLPSTDVAVVAGSVPATVFVDDVVGVTFNVDSVGTNDATGVALDVTVPATVSVNTVSTTSGTCSSGAGMASCAIGTIAGGSGVIVTLNTTAASDGNANFVATSTADIDANGNNNQGMADFTIDAAVDLAVLPAAATQVTLDQSVTIRPALENRSSLAASNITLTITPDAGLRIDSASWASGTCNIDGNGVATCQAASIVGQGMAAIDLRFTAIAVGAQSYIVAVTATELDRDMSNNNRVGQVTVGAATPPPDPQSDDSGSGSFDWLTLLLLGLAAAPSRRRARGITPLV